MYREDLAPRVHFDHPVELKLADQAALSARALNVSPGGMFICSPVLLPVGTCVQVSCELMPGVELSATATVVRAVHGDGLEPSGMGLRFDELAEASAWQLAAYIDRRLQPGRGEPVRLQISELAAPVRATTQGLWENLVSVDAELPFLKLGSDVGLQPAGAADVCSGSGQIRWVEVHVCPETGVPRLNIGIQLAEPSEPGDRKQHDEAIEDTELTFDEAFDEALDPVCTDEYIAYARSLSAEVHEERRRAGAAN